jgi:hypothetical protein
MPHYASMLRKSFGVALTAAADIQAAVDIESDKSVRVPSLVIVIA